MFIVSHDAHNRPSVYLKNTYKILLRARKFPSAYGAHGLGSNLNVDALLGVRRVPADLRSTIYRAVAKSGDEATWEIFLRLYKSTELAEEKSRIMNIIGKTKTYN